MTVIIPTHERIDITTINIELLLAQGLTVVIVVSSIEELKYYSALDVHVVMAPNNPLGAKWQKGVDYARAMDPDSILILGSDDLLSKYFFRNFHCTDILNDSETWEPGIKSFIAFDHWYVWANNALYHLEYLANQPLGGGRVYPRALLEALDWKLFEVSKNKLLDDFAWNLVKNSYGQRIISEPHILAVKGPWQVINKFDARHPNVKVIKTFTGIEAQQIMIQKFNYAS